MPQHILEVQRYIGLVKNKKYKNMKYSSGYECIH